MDKDKLFKAAMAVIDTIEATGGVVETNGGATFAPSVDEDWTDLGLAYIDLCKALDRSPMVSMTDDEDDDDVPDYRIIGSFETHSGALRISDPCYSKDSWCAGSLPAVSGTWVAAVRESNEGSWGKRVAELVVHHKDMKLEELIDSGDWVDTGIDVGVDSGQCGVFDELLYKDDYQATGYVHSSEKIRKEEPFYSMCCDLTITRGAGTMMAGAVSSSGYGDGSYEAFVIKQNDKAVAIKIVFIGEGDEE